VVAGFGLSRPHYHPALPPYIWISPVTRLVANSSVAVSAVVVPVSGVASFGHFDGVGFDLINRKTKCAFLNGQIE
jgi:hypothetical protein